MDFELLRTFLEVARLRHFGQAAEALNLTQAAVSARIKLLETNLGVRLFDRIRRDIQLTPEGHGHPLYAGKPNVFDGYISHVDEVTHLPPGAVLLASNAYTRVQAAAVTGRTCPGRCPARAGGRSVNGSASGVSRRWAGNSRWR